MTNTTDSPVQYRIKLKPKVPVSEINLTWPVTGLRGWLPASESNIVALFTKKTPLSDVSVISEIEKLDIKLTW